MKKLIPVLILISSQLFGADAAYDLLLTQRKDDNSGNIQRNVAPAATSILGFDAGKHPSNYTTTGSGTVVALATGAVFVAPQLGTPASGNLSNCTALPTSSLTGTLQAAQEPAHTGDVTNSAGSLALALVNIPSATPAAGSILYTNSAAPSSPASGKVSVFADSTDLRFHDKNASGVIGTTVVADTGASNNFLTAISAAGVISKAQPSISNISGFGTGVATALGVNVGSAGAPVLFNGAGGTPSSMTGTNISGTAASLTAGSATILSTARTINGVSFNGSANITVNSYPSILLNYVQATDIGQTTVSATTWTTLLADQTFTVTNASAPIDVFIPLAIQVNDASISIGTYVKAAVRIQIDDTTNYFLSTSIAAAVTLNSDVFYLKGGCINIGTLSAAAHTIRVQVYSDTALTSGASGFYCRASTVPNTEFLTMQVIQRN